MEEGGGGGAPLRARSRPDRARGGERRRRADRHQLGERGGAGEAAGIGPSKAQAIVEFREKEPFVEVGGSPKVKGIGDKLFESIKDQVTVGDAPSPKGRGS
jgi:competence ComEA-like helix-hairpin-helix protein